MWIMTLTINESIDRDQAIQQLTDFGDFIDALLAEGKETSNKILPPYDPSTRMETFGPSAVYKRAWDLESSARAAADFVNNHSAKQMTATFDGEQDI